MASPIVSKLIDGATSSTAGEDMACLGHYHVGLFVEAEDTADLSELTVRLEASPDGETWGPVKEPASASEKLLKADLADLEEDPDSGNYAVMLKQNAVYAQHVRARIVSYSGTSPVSAWVLLAGNEGQGRKGTSHRGPVQG